MKYDLSGKKFGRLTAIETVGVNSHRERLWKCLCECGNETTVNSYALVSGHTKSCGCFSVDTARERNTKHGERRSRLYRIYSNMMLRCYNKNNDNYRYYGGKGVKVCDEWRGENGSTNFCKWAKKNGYQIHLTLDRIDSNGNYSPDNCRWVTIKQQQNNKSNNVHYNLNGTIKTKAEWADYFGVKYSTFQTMIKRFGFDETVKKVSGDNYG